MLGLIEENALEEAQLLLDEQNERDGQWHYFQSLLYQKKGWFYESKKQMEIALRLDPENADYAAEYEKLRALGDVNPEAKAEVPAEELDGKAKKGKCCTKDDCCFMGAECTCECCATGLCEAICDGCS